MASLENLLESAVQGLLYLSESDAEFEVVSWRVPAGLEGDSLEDLVRRQEGIDETEPVEICDFSDFFAPLIASQDWHGEAEREAQERYVALKSLLKEHLTEISVFKFGEVEKRVFIVGCTEEAGVCGLVTEAVET